ncbi:PREDICTED: potassium channel subfamily U member 1-like [Galeopterus variegatus]|uniref:Potassium channel subfamily U member 1-like n=1 Tax=Galeopterus variegatus TaxID=482537 RepID=A0ABM0S109_GALVR|nr:PREDICTED: potassium channel subfamily U member 1-like [Galeopterus variegatus]
MHIKAAQRKATSEEKPGGFIHMLFRMSTNELIQKLFSPSTLDLSVPKGGCQRPDSDDISRFSASWVLPGRSATLLLGQAVLQDGEQESEQLDSSGMFHWCKTTPLDKVILKRTDKSKHEFRNHIVACVFGDAHSTLMGLRNFVMPLRTSNYTRKELKDIVFIGSLDYLQKEWRFLRNFPQIYVLPGSAFYSGDLHAVNIEECSMCAILSPQSQPSSSQTLVDTETIMATLNIGSLRIRPSTPEGTSSYAGGKSKYRRVPILTELKNPYNIHFIEPLGGLEGSLTGTNLHLSTSFSTGTVFSGSFLDSLLATAFYNYHVLELLQMLVTGGSSSQLEQHLDKKFCGTADSCSTFLSGRTRCKLGLLDLNQTILSDIKPRDTFGQLFCGSLNKFGILCVGLYRMIDEEKFNPEHRRGVCQFVITRPANECKLLPSDLVFCAIPFRTVCYKRGEVPPSKAPYEIINTVPLTPETQADPTTLSQSGPINVKTSQTHLNKNVEENGKENLKEMTEEDASAYSKLN